MTASLILENNPADRGEAMGRAQSDLLKAAIAEFKRRCAAHGCDGTDFPDRARQLTTLVNSLVPEWIIEARAVAAAAGVPVATFLAMSSSPDVMHSVVSGPWGEGSIACAAAGQICTGARAYLHLSRDGRRMPQYALSRASSPGTLAYVALSGGAELGLHAFVNEAGLAGCMLLGPVIKDPGSGLRPQMILRALAERCSTCAQAAGYCSELQGRYGLYTPGDRGVNFLLADAAGEFLQIEARALKIVSSAQREGLVVQANHFQLPDSPGGPQARDNARQRQVREHLLSGPLNPLRALATARLPAPHGERGICNEHTVSAFTAVLGGPNGPWAAVTLGAPGCAPPVAVFPGAGVPQALLDGSAWNAAENAFARYGLQGVPAERRARMDEDFAQLVAPLSGGLYAAREEVTVGSFALLLDFMDEAQAP